jgi:hypothetical protein
MRNDQLEIQPEHFEFESEAPFGEMENGVGEFEEEFGEFEGSFGEMEAPATQKNWYYFDAWRRAADGSVSRMANYGPRQETESEASRLFDVFCLNSQNSGQGSGKVLTRCYQWFPASSRWVACKNVVGFKRGMCSSDESELGEFEAFEQELETTPAQPSFRIDCAAGCAPLPAGQCRRVVFRAVRDAIWLANNAVTRLNAALANQKTKKLTEQDKDTIKKFRFFFGHDPSRLIPWADNKPSGESVAIRFSRCARELGGGRRTLYRCGCPGLPATTNAFTNTPTEIWLCPPFFGPSPQAGLSPRFFRAAVILHEMMHQLFIEFVLHNANEHRRNNAHCYEAFALRLAGHAADRFDVCRCTARNQLERNAC